MIAIFFMWLIVLGVVVYIKIKSCGFVDNPLSDIEDESSAEGISNETKPKSGKETFIEKQETSNQINKIIE